MTTETREKRSYLRESEIDQMLKASKKVPQRNIKEQAIRNYTLILMLYRHGLRISEALSLEWDDIDHVANEIHIRRAKGGVSGSHPLTKSVGNALRSLRRVYPDSNYLFVGHNNRPITVRGAQKIVEKAWLLTDIKERVHPHKFRHSCGYHVINNGTLPLRQLQGYLGHKNVQNTQHYAALAAKPFKNMWKD